MQLHDSVLPVVIYVPEDHTEWYDEVLLSLSCCCSVQDGHRDPLF